MPKFKVKIVDTYVGKREAFIIVDATDQALAIREVEALCDRKDAVIQWREYVADTDNYWEVTEVEPVA